MIKKIELSVLTLLLCVGMGFAQEKTINIKGYVKFSDNKIERDGKIIDPGFVMSVIQRNGFDKKTIAECPVNDDHTYSLTVPIDIPGVLTLQCSFWQSVQFWGEDEDLEINFRGKDTARIVIKNPPYVHINGGKNNELMNLVNWDAYRGYQQMIAISQTMYKVKGLPDEEKQATTMNLYGMLNKDSEARLAYLAEHYSDRNSVLALLDRIGNQPELEKSILAKFETKNPNYAPLLKYKKDKVEAAAQKAKMALGQKAPEFSYPTADGKKQYGPQDFKGKIVVIDFWASWCGPCRQEIPNLKEAYEKYHEKGVEFLSVSIDKDKSAWMKAMNEEKMLWYQVLAPKAGSDLMKMYQFSGIPFIVLLDKNGNIVAKNLRGKSLQTKIEEILSGKPKQAVSMRAMSM